MQRAVLAILALKASHGREIARGSDMATPPSLQERSVHLGLDSQVREGIVDGDEGCLGHCACGAVPRIWPYRSSSRNRRHAQLRMTAIADARPD